MAGEKVGVSPAAPADSFLFLGASLLPVRGGRGLVKDVGREEEEEEEEVEEVREELGVK